MSTGVDMGAVLQAKVLDAVTQRTPLRIVGRNTKAFYGRAPSDAPGVASPTTCMAAQVSPEAGCWKRPALTDTFVADEDLSIARHYGVVSYEPTELVITARAGSSLADIEALLAAHGQMLPFEPPYFGVHGEDTLGGMIACGLSGPRRPYAGSVRDMVLGMKVLTGKGEILQFGGQVMKNVAGFDVSRLMVGALGTLGILLEMSLKVLPRATSDATRVFSCNVGDAISRMNAWAGQPFPLSAAMFYDGQLYVRLSGGSASVSEACRKLGGESHADSDGLWASVRNHKHVFFHDDTPLWRVCVPQAAPPVNIPGAWLLDWGGAQRWLKTSTTDDVVREQTMAAKGHAMLFRGGNRQGQVFHPLSPALVTLHRRLKAEFDPHGILNRGRMYADA